MPESPLTLSSAAAAQTERIAAELTERLRPGDVVLLSGDLGAGKTTFVRGAARALDVGVPVTSPTFTIGHIYELSDRSPRTGAPSVRTRAGLRAIAHLDLYRLGSIAAEDPDLLADYIGADTITFVEWPAAAEYEVEELGRVAFRVLIEHAGGDARTLTISAGGQLRHSDRRS